MTPPPNCLAVELLFTQRPFLAWGPCSTKHTGEFCSKWPADALCILISMSQTTQLISILTSSQPKTSSHACTYPREASRLQVAVVLAPLMELFCGQRHGVQHFPIPSALERIVLICLLGNCPRSPSKVASPCWVHPYPAPVPLPGAESAIRYLWNECLCICLPNSL